MLGEHWIYKLFTCYLNIHVRNYAGKPLESGFFARLTSYEYGLTVYSGLLLLEITEIVRAPRLAKKIFLALI